MTTTVRSPQASPTRPRQRQRVFLAAGLLLTGLALVIFLSLTNGSVALTWPELVAAALRQGDTVNQTILWDLRLPRVLAALLVGAALGLAGALLQGMLRNGLASPFLLGISAGAGLMVVLVVGVGLLQIWVPLGAWLGAVVTTLLVYLLARTGTTLSVERLILGGVAFSSFFGAIQSLMLLMSPDGQIQAALNWLIGSLNGRGWTEVTLVGPGILVASIAGCLLARQVNLLSLGDDLATGLGTSLLRSRCLIGAVATLLAAGGGQHCGAGRFCRSDCASWGAVAGGHGLSAGAAVFRFGGGIGTVRGRPHGADGSGGVASRGRYGHVGSARIYLAVASSSDAGRGLAMPLETRNLAGGYGDRPIVAAVNLSLQTGEWLSLLGANGSGKSTLLRLMSRILKPQAGVALLDGRDIHHLSPTVAAQKLALLPQQQTVPEGLTVYQLVSLGRSPHQPWWQWELDADGREQVEQALHWTEIVHYRDRPVIELSGGERQRAFFGAGPGSRPQSAAAGRTHHLSRFALPTSAFGAAETAESSARALDHHGAARH